MAVRFKAAVLERTAAPLVVREVQIGDLLDDDVLVRVRASGLCHTDLEIMQGQIAHPVPAILGHEGAGIVEAVGRDVTLVKPGDHVIASWNPSCGHCFYCDRDQPILCEAYTRTTPAGELLDGGSRLTLDGGRLHHFSQVSSHAEYCVVSQTGAIAVPKEIPFDRACLIGCGVMTGVGAVSRKAKVEAGASVAVIGCGAVGLNAIQAAALEDAGAVIALEVDERRKALARTFGATHVLDGRSEGIVQQVRDLTGGRGADYVIESAGNQAGFQLSVEIVRTGGTVVWLGKTGVNLPVSFRWGALMGEKQIVRSSYGGARPRRDFPWLARLYLDGRLKLDELITRRLRLDQINEGFAGMTTGEIVRAVVAFD